VAVSGTRPAPVTAAAIGTINALAPGRTFLGVGAGNTAMRIMGQPPHRIAELDRYLSTLRPLLAGGEAWVGADGDQRPIRHIMPDRGFVNFDDPIPLYVSGFGPRSLGLAGKHGDGAVLAMPPHPNVMAAFRSAIESGAQEVGRTLDEKIYQTTALTTISVLDDGQDANSPRIREECGAFAMATVHYAYDQWRQLGQGPPAFLADVWDEYTGMLDEVPTDRLHQRIHAGHNCWVMPEEEKFVSGALIEATCTVGTAGDLVNRLRLLEAAGLHQVMILPAFDPRYAVLERVAADVLPNVR
jgi:alkanesulfonate monooxygenase SsuD/methylene tetrahydromethanopterin reductase-like flavin-dependent oxidoreductase (luciferase family)